MRGRLAWQAAAAPLSCTPARGGPLRQWFVRCRGHALAFVRDEPNQFVPWIQDRLLDGHAAFFEHATYLSKRFLTDELLRDAHEPSFVLCAMCDHQLKKRDSICAGLLQRQFFDIRKPNGCGRCTEQ
jgi:hypothetical protein